MIPRSRSDDDERNRGRDEDIRCLGRGDEGSASSKGRDGGALRTRSGSVGRRSRVAPVSLLVGAGLTVADVDTRGRDGTEEEIISDRSRDELHERGRTCRPSTGQIRVRSFRGRSRSNLGKNRVSTRSIETGTGSRMYPGGRSYGVELVSRRSAETTDSTTHMCWHQR